MKPYINPKNPGGWRKHNEYPTKKEASEAFSTLIGWCVGQGLKEGNYSNLGLLLRIRKYVNRLRK